MPFVGIDIGSQSVKVIVMEGDEILSSYVGESILQGYQKAWSALTEALKKPGLSMEDIQYTLATGYGRFQFPGKGKHISEISCHAKGVHWYYPKVKTILDIGAQDTKAINCNERGGITNFVLNNKCAGGTGRFLEVMADILGIPLEKLGELSLQFKNDIKLNNTCVVFAKTEALNLIRNGVSKSDIAAGLHASVTTMCLNLLGGISLIGDLCLTGGVSKNIGVVEKIRNILRREVLIPPDPQLVGAIGAALFAREIFLKGVSDV